MKKPFAPEGRLIGEHAREAHLPLQETKIRVPRICTACRYDRRYYIGVALVHREPYWHNARRFSVSTRVLQRHRKRFFETYPKLKRWHERERLAWQRGDTETRTLTGRCRMDVQKLTDRLNAPVQGTGADGLKLALALLWERRGECPGAVPVLVCHDEVVVECDEDRGEETKRWLEMAMVDGMYAVMNGMGKAPPCRSESRLG
jgi:DNA polymerase-1